MRGMGNMQGMMKKVQKMQKEMQEAQQQLAVTEYEGAAASDMVTVKFTGDKLMKDIVIKPEAIDPDDPDMLQDLIIEAINDVMQKIDRDAQAQLGKYSRGLPM